MVASIFDVNKQLTFYGAYHSNKINVLIHIVCVPILLWTAFVLAAPIELPSFFPKYAIAISPLLQFELNVTSITAAVYMAYYFILEPFAAALYLPQMILSVLTATAFARGPGNISKAAVIHGLSWIAQFLGHGLAEKRAPALLDNLLGAVVLAPFFVHLELLFAVGYAPEQHKRLQNEIGKEIAKIRKAQGDKKRAAAAKKN
ncbi:DUF962-domain-containing protein [Pluteus cervinus]|uniref:DUF962-domain-containing protein n=1 Tax=Pluteus cervinus TaxID=181527 RepID=A0ACD3B901_9AGAR|nr:DUF962-domain-containing protein [Pluteus cervinus]